MPTTTLPCGMQSIDCTVTVTLTTFGFRARVHLPSEGVSGEFTLPDRQMALVGAFTEVALALREQKAWEEIATAQEDAILSAQETAILSEQFDSLTTNPVEA